MKNISKENVLKALGGIVCVALLIVGVAACGGGDSGGGGKSATIEATANSSGSISINWQQKSNDTSCEVTTDLPSPNDKFTLTFTSLADPNNFKTITGLSAGQKVTITVTLPSDPVELASSMEGSYITIIAHDRH